MVAVFVPRSSAAAFTRFSRGMDAGEIADSDRACEATLLLIIRTWQVNRWSARVGSWCEPPQGWWPVRKALKDQQNIF